MDGKDEARDSVHGMTAKAWKARYQKEASPAASRVTMLSLGHRGRLGIRNGAVRAVTNGGRYRDRTYGPYHVKVVLSR